MLYSVFPASRYEPVATSDRDTALYRALDENGQQIGWCAQACSMGYAGPVAVTLGVGMDGYVTGAVIGDKNFVETVGFGRRWKDEAKRLDQFLDLHVVYGGEIDCIVGATVTSNAVLDATNAALQSIAEANGMVIESPVVFGLPKPVYETIAVPAGALSVSCRGFASTVTAYVTLDDRGCIESLVLDTSGETSVFGALVMEDSAFISQFIGKAGPFTAGVDVDVHTGATVTSNAVIGAINSLFPSDTAQTQPATEIAPPVAADEDALTASAKGLLSEVTVTVTLDDTGAIATISVDCSGEIPAISGPCAEEPFLSQFVGRVGPFDDIEIVTGATVTSNAVIEAVNSLFPSDATQAQPAAADEDALTASAKGLLSDVTVTVTLDDTGAIATISVDCSGETAAIAAPCAEEPFLSQFIGRVGPFDDIDIVTGATFTSNAVIEAVNSLFPDY